MTNTSSRRPIDSKQATQILQKRLAAGFITRNDVGKRYSFRVSGPGNDMDVKNKDGEYVESVVEPGTVLRKRIYNVTAVSEVALSNPVIVAILKEAEAAEAAGDVQKASDLFNSWLNKISVSFNILHPLRPEFSALGKGDQVKGTVRMLTPEGEGTQGELITLEDVTPVMVTAIKGGPMLSLADITARATALGSVAATPFAQPVITDAAGAGN